MSAALQFQGRVGRRGFHLAFTLERLVHVPIGVDHEGRPYGYDKREDAETETCTICGRQHATIYRAWRRPVGTWGCWVVFRYLGEEHVPDLSLPIGVSTIPRGAVKLSTDDASRYWHS